jgi:hypothetical protein
MPRKFLTERSGTRSDTLTKRRILVKSLTIKNELHGLGKDYKDLNRFRGCTVKLTGLSAENMAAKCNLVGKMTGLSRRKACMQNKLNGRHKKAKRG